MAYTATNWVDFVDPPIDAINLNNIETGLDDIHNQTTLVQATVRRIQESGGPTTLVMAAVADGEYLKRNGATIDGGTPAAGGGWTECARVYRDTDQSIPDSAFTSISFSHERFDTDAIWAIANPTRLTCRTAGIYQITGHGRFDSGAASTRYLTIRLNGVTTIVYVREESLAAKSTDMVITTLWEMEVNDYVELRAWQNTGGALDVLSVSRHSPEFMMARVG